MYPLLHVFGVDLPSYGVMMMVGVLVCSIIGCRRSVKAGLQWENAIIIGACGFAFALLGAALLYLFVTYPIDQIIQLVTTFKAPEGMVFGLVFYGGLLGAVPGILLGAKVSKSRLSDYIGPLVPLIPLGHAFGRVGCFLAGCCYGRPTEHPIGVVYRESLTGVPTDVALLPVQLFEAAALAVIAGILFFLAAKKIRPAVIIGAYSLLYGICRFSLENLRYDAIRGIYFGLSTSQWISILLITVGAILLVKSLVERRKAAAA